MITLSSAVLVPALLTRAGQAGTDISLSTSDREVSAVSSSDNGFGVALDSLYPGLSADPIFQKIAPLSILITHKRGPAVRAFTISWKVTSANGTFETKLFSYVSPGSALKGQSTNTLRSARRPVLKLGQSRLITPFFSWTPTYYKSNPEPAWGKLLQQAEPGSFLVSELSNASAVEIEIDGLVFSDWKIVGPDKHDLTRRLRSRRNAEHDEGLVVFRLMKLGASDSEIKRVLLAHGAAQRSTKKTSPGRWYEQSRRFQAQFLLRAFVDADRASFSKALNRLVSQKSTSITRASL